MSRRARAQISCSSYLCACDIGKDALNCLVLTYCDLQNNLEVLSSVQQLIYDPMLSTVAMLAERWRNGNYPHMRLSIPQSNEHCENRGNRSTVVILNRIRIINKPFM